MKLAVASGKGGTGKTTLSLAITMVVGSDVQLLDCDVEEPNDHIFLKLENEKTEKMCVKVPEIDKEKCVLCGKCSEVCEFNAIAALKDKVMIFPELCHSCGGCAKVCPVDAIYEKDKVIGTIMKANIGDVRFVQGKLDVGHALSPPIIRAVKSNIDDGLNIIDCPPGNACPVITSLNGADFVILITEATPFGLHDLTLSVDTLRRLGLPFGVVINRADIGFNGVETYCNNENIDILLKIPESMEVAKSYSKGETLLQALPWMEQEIKLMLDRIKEVVS